MKLKTFALAATAMLILVGCEKEQSEFTLTDLSGSCKVQGTVTFDAGYTESNGVIISKNVSPKADVQLILSVPYADYASGTGKKQYFATTDAAGKYTFEIPVGVQTLANAQVEVIAFSAAKGFLVDGKVASVSNAIFDQGIGAQAVAIEGNKILVRDFDITSADVLDQNLLSGTKKFTVSGFAKLDAAQWKSDKLADGVTNNPVSAPVGTKIKLVLSNISDAQAATITYAATVGDGGAYTLDVPFFDAWSYNDVKVKAEVVAFYANTTNDYRFRNLYVSSEAATEQATQRLTGVYEKAEGSNIVSTGELVVELGLNIADLIMKFTPDDQKIYGYSFIKYKDADDKNQSYTTYTPTACKTNWSKNNTANKYDEY